MITNQPLNQAINQHLLIVLCTIVLLCVINIGAWKGMPGNALGVKEMRKAIEILSADYHVLTSVSSTCCIARRLFLSAFGDSLKHKQKLR
jgi:hypothetical protein